MQERLYYISELIEKQLNDNLSAGETVELNKWLNSSDVNKKLYDQLHDEEFVKEQLEKFHRYDAEKNRAYLLKKLEESVSGESLVVRMKPKLWKRIAIAASVIFAIGIGSYFMFMTRETEVVSGEVTQEQRFKNDVDPGKYKAKLTLANGSEIVLDSAAIGELAKQGGTVVLNKDGQLVYKTDGKVNEVLYNTLSTSRGETYTTVLADGSKVWLNSASSIKYPVAFNGNERKVEITGEAYFEIAKDATKKFIVVGNGVTTEVLGTHFNVNTYTDEASVKVTLLEGSVNVRRGPSTGSGSVVKIKPGQQAVVSNDIKVVSEVDIDEVMAWKNGRFVFKSMDVQSLMRQLSRWYDIDVSFDDIPTTGFNARISRETSLINILKALELTGEVRFRIEGKKVIVMK